MSFERLIHNVRNKIYEKINLSNEKVNIDSYNHLLYNPENLIKRDLETLVKEYMNILKNNPHIRININDFKNSWKDTKDMFYWKILDYSKDWKEFTIKTYDYFYSRLKDINLTYELIGRLFDYAFKRKNDHSLNGLKYLPIEMTRRFTNESNYKILPTGGFDKFLHFTYAGLLYKRYKILAYPLIVLDKLVSLGYEPPSHIIEDIKAGLMGIKYYKKKKREELKFHKKYNFKMLHNFEINKNLNSKNEEYEMFINKTTMN